jgi:hypothetical protein
MTGYVGETKNLKRRHIQHRDDIWPGRRELVSKIGDPVVIKADFKNMNAVKFAEHAVYEKYKDLGYDMLQKPPHPNIFNKYKDRVDDCKICDELGCDFTKERLEYIIAVHRVSKLCMNPACNKPFYFDPIKHNWHHFKKQKYCSYICNSKIIGEKKQSGSFNVSKLCMNLTCNKPFYFDKNKYGSLQDFNKITFCSNICRAKEKYNTGSYNISKLCPVCNKVLYFSKKKYQGLKKFNERTFCSVVCANKGKWKDLVI